MSVLEFLSNCFHSKKSSNKSSLLQASKAGDVQVLRRLVQSRISHVNEQNRFGRTPLHYACRYGHTEAARVLVDEGRARLDVVTKNGSSIAHDCCRFGQADALRLVLSHDDGLVFTANTYGSLPIHIASSVGSTECVQVLLDWHTPLTVRNKRGMLPLHIACDGGYEDMALLLLAHAPYEQLLVRDVYDSLPLHHACQSGMPTVVYETIRLIENLGPCTPILHSPDCSGNTPLDYISKQAEIYANLLNDETCSPSLFTSLSSALLPSTNSSSSASHPGVPRPLVAPRAIDHFSARASPTTAAPTTRPASSSASRPERNLCPREMRYPQGSTCSSPLGPPAFSYGLQKCLSRSSVSGISSCGSHVNLAVARGSQAADCKTSAIHAPAHPTPSDSSISATTRLIAMQADIPPPIQSPDDGKSCTSFGSAEHVISASHAPSAGSACRGKEKDPVLYYDIDIGRPKRKKNDCLIS